MFNAKSFTWDKWVIFAGLSQKTVKACVSLLHHKTYRKDNDMFGVLE